MEVLDRRQFGFFIAIPILIGPYERKTNEN
jgi:hypothetical protein